jgi:endonuclease/exonuclease/phosphatase family metal-dependent hydrolase
LLILYLNISCKEKPKEINLTLMTYNIYHGEHYYENGKSNLEDIASIIKEVNPDFIALQEVDSMTMRTAGFNAGDRKNLVSELAKMTGMFGYFAKAIDYSDGGYGEGLLTKHNATMSQIKLPSPQGGEERAMALATFTFDNGQQITFGATHFCHEHEENKVAQTAAVIAYLKNIPHATILAGDLNFTPDSESYQTLKVDFLDAAEVYGNPANTIPFDSPRSRIDYIWLSKNNSWEVSKVQVIPVGHADHMPVVVSVTLKDKTSN